MSSIAHPRQFASDNWSGICPEAWAAMEEANAGHDAGYGDDQWTERASDAIRELFETRCEVFFTFNGTAANSLALASTCQSYHSILCHETAHVETHECGAPEFFSNGTKVLLVPGEHGKMEPAAIEQIVTRRRDIHYPKPRAISLTQPTEWGTVYSVDELKAIGELASRHDLRVHMDGARFANAVATLGVKPKEITWQAGVDVLCLGGSKNGMAVGEAVVFFDEAMAFEFDYRCKQAGQLASKMRFLSAPWVGMLRGGAWLARSGHANRMATLLAGELRTAGFHPLHPCEANMVFVELTPDLAAAMQARGWEFHSMTGRNDQRFVCSWDTREEDVRSLVADLEACRAAAARSSTAG